MAEFPSPADLFAFVVLFFPGFVSLSIALRLHNVSSEKIGAVEKTVLSFALSVAIFFVAGIPLDPLAPSRSVLTYANLTIAFSIAVALGLIIAVLYYAWTYIELGVTDASNWVGAKLGLTLVPGTALEGFLDLLWEHREKSYVVVMDKNGQMFRGFLGMLSLEPTAQLVLSRFRDKNPEKLENGTWHPIDQWALAFAEDNIRWIGAHSM